MIETVAAADPWAALRTATQARIGLRRTGDAPGIASVLALQLDHARARVAVAAEFDAAEILRAFGSDAIIVGSRASDRSRYIRRPDLGRSLDDTGAARLPSGPFDAAFVLADGLSAVAGLRQGPALLEACRQRLRDWKLAPLVVARQARVALGDEIGARLQAQLVVVLIGERPGLSVVDALSGYLTWEPRVGRRDSERNCVSGIRQDGGLSIEQAADKLTWLMGEARRRRLSGIELKDTQPVALSGTPGQACLD